MESFPFDFSLDKPEKVWRLAVGTVKKFGFVKALIQQNTGFSEVLQVKQNFNYFARKK